MGILGYLARNGIELFQAMSIAVGFVVTIHTLKEDAKERKIQNLFALTEAHREVWTKLYDKPELARILNEDADLTKTPVTHEEELFVNLLVQNLRVSFKARKASMGFNDDAVSEDIREFFALPIPKTVWQKLRTFQDKDFVEFVESSIAAKS